MDEGSNVKITVRRQETLGSEDNSDLRSLGEGRARRLCLVGPLGEDAALKTIAETFQLPVVSSEDGNEYGDDATIFIMEHFEGEVFTKLYRTRQPLLGALALKQLAKKGGSLPDNTRPLFNLAMAGVVVCFTGFREKEELAPIVPLIHHMGGSIRKNMSEKVTHLIAKVCGGQKYQYANTFRVPAMNPQWVFDSWERRNDIEFRATLDVFVTEHKLKPFHGAKVAFIGFPEEEEKHMTEVLQANGGSACNLEDPECTHVVMERAEIYSLDTANGPLSPTPNPNPSLNPLSATTATNLLETLHEKSNDYCPSLDETAEISYLDQSINSITSGCRKRKNPASELKNGKRRKDKSISETKRKISGIFKTPINYFSNRRRTIDATSFNQTLNESVMSSSGIFNVETVQNLSCFDETCSGGSGVSTPQGIKKNPKKNLFMRTFSSSKFSKMKSKKSDLNLTRLSFDDRTENNENLNKTCFPSISLNPGVPSEFRSDCSKEKRGPLPSIAVVDESCVSAKPDASSRTFVVKAEWFWTSVQKEICLEEKDYLYDDYVEQTFSPNSRRESHQATPSSASRRKRKRLETFLSLGHQQSPGLHKRRSSVSDAGLLSVSGSFLDCTASPDKVLDGAEAVIDSPRKGQTERHQVFLELVQTESNYVDILHTIMFTFKKYLEEMPEQEALLNPTEVNFIFGKVPPIYETHVKMRDEMLYMCANWTEDCTIGNIIVKYSNDLLKAYPPYINFFEEMKEILVRCDQLKPRFHAFLKACQTRPECGRQNLQELMIRPVQRLGSVCLLLGSILKNTSKTNPDHEALVKAQAALKKVMDDINEDKRKAEAQVTLFNIFNDIDNCPPDIVSSHRNFIGKAEVLQVSSTEGLSRRGNTLMLFLFSDQLEVCKKKSKAFNNLKSPNMAGSLPRPKLYKHIKLIPLNTIKRVIDIKETDQCQKVFCLMCRNNDETKERVYSFAMADDETEKAAFLKMLTRQMANNSCTPDADKFLAYLEPHQLDIDTSDMSNGTLSRAFKFASKTRDKVGRAFSFNKTPSKLKRAVSSMMSPFGSSNNITPSSELAQMRLASYSNLNELSAPENGSEPPPMAPMSVQPTRKVKSNFLNVIR